MNIKNILTYTIIAAGVVALLMGYDAGPEGPSGGYVVDVFDGDTILVDTGAKKMKVRLLGIDTPEKKGPYTKAEAGGAEASRRARELALEQEIDLQYGSDYIWDKYGRLLAYVVLPDGRAMNEILLKEGLAKVYRRSDHDERDRYLHLEEKARRACLGLWKKSCKR